MIPLLQLRKIFSCINHNKDNYINELREAIRFKSVSNDPSLREEVIKMTHWFDDTLKKTGFKTEICEIGLQEGYTDLKLPPILLATYKGALSKKTILFYGHIDVYPAIKSDGWFSEPFELAERGDKLVGRGVSDNKGPILVWINAVSAYRDSEVEVPINIKFVLEGMEVCMSEGLCRLVEKKKTFFKDVDYICISNTSWSDKVKPCLSYGLRGICYFKVSVQCARRDLHSGVYGGVVNEAMSDLIYLLGSLTGKDGRILVPGIYSDVRKLTTKEDEAVMNIDFNMGTFKETNGIKRLLFKEDQVKVLHHVWRFPSLSQHGIENVSSIVSSYSTVPAKVVGSFSIRTVPNQTSKRVEKLVVDHMKKKWKERDSDNEMEVTMTKRCEPWVADPSLPPFEAARKALRIVYEVEPDMIRDGKSYFIVNSLAESAKSSLVLLPISSVDDCAQSENEKLDVRNFVQGIKVVAAFFSEASAL